MNVRLRDVMASYRLTVTGPTSWEVIRVFLVAGGGRAGVSSCRLSCAVQIRVDSGVEGYIIRKLEINK